jgi:hypothetical protein
VGLLENLPAAPVCSVVVVAAQLCRLSLEGLPSLSRLMAAVLFRVVSFGGLRGAVFMLRNESDGVVLNLFAFLE